jgi:hypothetical protein
MGEWIGKKRKGSGVNGFDSMFFEKYSLASVSCLCFFSTQKVDTRAVPAYHAIETILSATASNDKIAQLQPR